MELEGKTALITGGSRGIGAAIALELARNGAEIAICDLRRADETAHLFDAVRGLGKKVIFLQADVADFGRAQEVVAKVVSALGHLDILVNNAGINSDRVIWKMSEEDWDRVISVNLKGAFNYARAVAPVFRTQRGGKIINISSVNGLRGQWGLANYAAAKAGLIGLTKTLAKELGKYHVNVNAVAPGYILTRMTENLPQAAQEEALRETILGQLGTPEDVAHLVTFLCTERARQITGEVIKVDGGQYI
jgi:3-oxoacyl-[acyl-carrier protein] reductase